VVSEVQPIDLEAFQAIDQQRLLCVLSRAIDEEAARYKGDDSSDEGSGKRTRLQAFCRLVSMIRETNESGPESRASVLGRKGSRSL
jgi:hypothetical protein